MQKGTSLHLDPEHPVARRVAAQAQGDLLVLVRTINEKTGKLRQDIQVDDVRRTVSFFGSTAGEGGWRVALVDSVDELNDEGANALLKVLEEPPRRALLLLVSHSAHRVLPTIRSRCRMLALRPLSQDDVARAAAAATGAKADDANVKVAAAIAEGSVGRALALLDSDALELRERRPPLWRRSRAARRLRRYRQCMALGAVGGRPTGAWPHGARGRGLGEDQPVGTRRRGVQSRAKTLRFQRVRLACRGNARLIPILGLVMAGLDPAIHVFLLDRTKTWMSGATRH